MPELPCAAAGYARDNVYYRQPSPRHTRAVASPLVGRLLQLSTAGVLMDGARSQGEILGGVMAFAQPAGRGIYVTDKLAAPVPIAVAGR